MAAINLRQDKERPLTIAEVDFNFSALNAEVGQKLDTSAYNAVNILELLDGNAGAGSTLDSDKIHGWYPSQNSDANTVAIRDALGNLKAVQFQGLHIGNVIGDITGNGTGVWTGNATNVSGIVQLDHGGTGANTAANARTNLGLGTIATQNSSNITVTGGSVTGITDLAVADGGTGASTAINARSNLGLVIGSDIQAYNATLTGLGATTGNGFVIRKTDNSAVIRKFVAGNSIEITNVDGTAGDITVALTAIPSIGAITKTGSDTTGDLGQSNNRWGTVYTQYITLDKITKTGTNGTGDIGQSDNRFGSAHITSLGVGTGASGTAGEIRATNNVTAYYSDDRLKTRIGGLENALDKIDQLAGFYYEANETAQALGYDVKREVGLSAQDTQKVLPEVVAPAPIDDKYLTIRYERLAPLFVEGIKELRQELKAIKAHIGMK